MICVRSETYYKSFAFLSVLGATSSRGLTVVTEEVEVIQIVTYHASRQSFHCWMLKVIA